MSCSKGYTAANVYGTTAFDYQLFICFAPYKEKLAKYSHPLYWCGKAIQ